MMCSLTQTSAKPSSSAWTAARRIASALGELARARGLQVYTQDDPAFPETVPAPIDDTGLDISHHLKIEVVPTLIRLENGREVARTYGWDRGEWERLSGLVGLGRGL